MPTASMTQQEKAVLCQCTAGLTCSAAYVEGFHAMCVAQELFSCFCLPLSPRQEAQRGGFWHSSVFLESSPVTFQPPQALLEKLWNNPDSGRL